MTSNTTDEFLNIVLGVVGILACVLTPYLMLQSGIIGKVPDICRFDVYRGCGNISISQFYVSERFYDPSGHLIEKTPFIPANKSTGFILNSSENRIQKFQILYFLPNDPKIEVGFLNSSIIDLAVKRIYQSELISPKEGLIHVDLKYYYNEDGMQKIITQSLNWCQLQVGLPEDRECDWIFNGYITWMFRFNTSINSRDIFEGVGLEMKQWNETTIWFGNIFEFPFSYIFGADFVKFNETLGRTWELLECSAQIIPIVQFDIDLVTNTLIEYTKIK